MRATVLMGLMVCWGVASAMACGVDAPTAKSKCESGKKCLITWTERVTVPDDDAQSGPLTNFGPKKRYDH